MMSLSGMLTTSHRPAYHTVHTTMPTMRLEATDEAAISASTPVAIKVHTGSQCVPHTHACADLSRSCTPDRQAFHTLTSVTPDARPTCLLASLA